MRAPRPPGLRDSPHPMLALLDDPMFQAGLAPFAVALVAAWTLFSTRLAWLALVAALATVFALSTGISFVPLTAARKIMLLVLLASLVGALLDRWAGAPRHAAAVLAACAGIAGAWVFQSVIAQAEGAQGWLLGLGVAAFVAVLTALVLRLRDDGVATGAATLALGAAVGAAALLSASIGHMMNSVALAAGGGALLLVQMLRNKAVAPGYLGTLTLALAAALFAAAPLVLSQSRWFTIALLLPLPLVAGLARFGAAGLRRRMVLLTLLCLAVAALPVLAAWLATRLPAT
jgi:predicted outer membrane lipoprotein